VDFCLIHVEVLVPLLKVDFGALQYPLLDRSEPPPASRPD
jgi:hypothetical protein